MNRLTFVGIAAIAFVFLLFGLFSGEFWVIAIPPALLIVYWLKDGMGNDDRGSS